MTVDRIFFVYMVLVGIAAGAILVGPELRHQAVLLGLDCCRSVRWRVISVGAHNSGADADDGRAPGRLRVRNCNDGGHSGDRRRAGAVFLALNQLPSSSTQ